MPEALSGGRQGPLRMGLYQIAPTTNAAWEDLRQYTVSSQMLKGEEQVLIFLERSTNWTSVDFCSMKAYKLYLQYTDTGSPL